MPSVEYYFDVFIAFYYDCMSRKRPSREQALSGVKVLKKKASMHCLNSQQLRRIKH